MEEIIGKIIESRYIGICLIIDKIIDIGQRLPHIISDFRELLAKSSISKMTEELFKIYRYQKKITYRPPLYTLQWAEGIQTFIRHSTKGLAPCMTSVKL